ncbi:hypothetical protein GCM10011383_32320 [Hymenobacter cavernae]|uniref:Uncharacterized protein n=2 Tax=Hymenobacter cavernae TaxID=2044852 RepID=A0ABQ1UGN1_9BACT|nr:hypothetical protein GCM10011383_32320 [Hymenobacter cavernae]
MQIARNKKLQTQHVLKLTIMPRCDGSPSFFDDGSASRWCYTQQEIEALRIWHDYTFTNHAFSNRWTIQAAQQSLYRLRKYPNSVNGIRFRFYSGASYSDVVRVLDMLTRNNWHQYAVDNRGKTLTIYVLTEEPESEYSPKYIDNCLPNFL